MKITHLHINAFGKLHDKDFDFTKNVNTVCEQNGYGKTTLTVFIKAMFYSMAQTGRNKAYTKERSKFQPWDNGNYGGSLTFTINEKEYLMTRTFGKTPESDTFELINLKTGLKSNDYSKNIGQELFGVGEETFEISAFFPQNNLSGGVNDEMRASLTGVNKFEYDLASVSQATKSIASKMTVLRAQCPKQSEIDSLTESIENGQVQFANMQNSLQALSENCAAQEAELKETEMQYNQLKISKRDNDALKSYYEKQESDLKSNTLTRDKLIEQKAIIRGALDPKKKPKMEAPKIILFILGLVLVTLTVVSSIMAGFISQFRILFIILAAVFFASSLSSLIFAFKFQDKNQQPRVLYQMSDYLNIEKNIDEIAVVIKGIEEILSSKPQFDNEQNLTKLQENFYALDKQLSLLKQEKSALEVEVLRIDKYILDKQDELEKMLSFKQENAYNLNLLEKTKQYLLKAKENVSVRFIQPMQENFDKVLEKIISEKLQMDIDLNINKITDAGLKESEYLSRGYQDIISVCKRFALLDKIYTIHKPCIILDDPFVNLDDEKLEAAKKLVLEFGEKYQILYICSHSRLII